MIHAIELIVGFQSKSIEFGQFARVFRHNSNFEKSTHLKSANIQVLNYPLKRQYTIDESLTKYTQKPDEYLGI